MSEGGFYVRVRGKISGPFALEDMFRMIRQGVLSRFHEISTDRATWNVAGDYEDLFPTTSVAEPAPAPEPEPTPAPAPQPSFPQQSYDTAPQPQYPYIAAPPAPAQYPTAPLGYAAPQPYYASQSAYGQGQAVESHKGMAITAMVLSLVGIPCCWSVVLGVLGIIFGSIALAGMSRTGNTDGKGMALTGLILGIVEIVGMVIYVVVALVMS